MWKNCTTDYIGLVHYRRYFCEIDYLFKTNTFYIANKKKYNILQMNDISKLMKKCDIIVKRSGMYSNNKILFSTATTIGIDGWKRLEKVVLQRTEEEIQAFEKYSKARRHINCNMFIGKKTIVDSYCEWLFMLLSQIDDLYIQETGDRCHNRELGYFAEFLFGMWLDMKHVKYRVEDVINTDNADTHILTLKEYLVLKLSFRK